MNKKILIISAALGAIAVIFGAFGAHALRDSLDETQKEVYNKAVFYQFIHVVAAFITGMVAEKFTNKWIRLSGWMFIAGVAAFSGSLYLLSLREVIGLRNYGWLGPITPLGGFCFISGWSLLIIGLVRK